MARLYIVYRIIDVLLNRTVVRMKAPPVRSLWGGRRSMGERPPGSSLLCTPRRAGLPVAPSSADRPPLWSGQARPPFSSPRPHGPPPPPRAGRGDGVLGGTARRTRWGGRRTGSCAPGSGRTPNGRTCGGMVLVVVRRWGEGGAMPSPAPLRLSPLRTPSSRTRGPRRRLTGSPASRTPRARPRDERVDGRTGPVDGSSGASSSDARPLLPGEVRRGRRGSSVGLDRVPGVPGL